MLRLSEFSHNHLPSGVIMLAKFIRRGIPVNDGSWAIPWSWNGYSDEWAISKNWWKGNGAILNMLYRRGMGRI